MPVDAHLYTLDLTQAEGGAAAWKQLVRKICVDLHADDTRSTIDRVQQELKARSPEPQARIAPAMAAIGP